MATQCALRWAVTTAVGITPRSTGALRRAGVVRRSLRIEPALLSPRRVAARSGHAVCDLAIAAPQGTLASMQRICIGVDAPPPLHVLMKGWYFSSPLGSGSTWQMLDIQRRPPLVCAMSRNPAGGCRGAPPGQHRVQTRLNETALGAVAHARSTELFAELRAKGAPNLGEDSHVAIA